MNSNKILSKLSKATPLIRGTTLVTYTLPSYGNIWLSIEHLENELGTAKNIKDKNVRKAVNNALKSGIYQLKFCKKKKAPKNGLIMCSGMIEDLYF